MGQLIIDEYILTESELKVLADQLTKPENQKASAHNGKPPFFLPNIMHPRNNNTYYTYTTTAGTTDHRLAA